MSKFVVYTGQNANHDEQTRRMIRSRAMRDFRRRERINNINAFRESNTGETVANQAHDEKGRRSESHTPRLQGTASKLDPHVSSHPTTLDNFSSSVDASKCSSGSSARSFLDPSAAPSSVSLNSDPLIEYDDHASGSAFLDTARISAAPAVISHPHAPDSTELPRQRSCQPSTTVVCRSKAPLTNRTRGVVAHPPIRSHHTCQNCLWEADSCSICIASGFVDNANTQDFEITAPDYGYATDRGLDERPMYSMSSLSSRNPREQMALQYFQSVVVKDVSGIISTGFWERLVPQMCQMQDTVRHIAIALSQAHLVLATRTLSPEQSSSQVNSATTQSVESELKASRLLRKYIETSRSPSYELVLTCSIIFYTLDSLFGREASAILHLENALKMFKAWQKARKQAKSRTNEAAFHSLSTVLARLDMSVTIAHDDRVPAFEHHDGIPPTMSDKALVAALSFANPHDAHYQLTRVTTPTAVFLVQHHSWRGTYARFMPSEIVEEYRMHRSRFHAWDMVMERYESDRLCYNGANDKRAEAMSLLATRMVHWSAQQLLEEFICDDHVVCNWDRTSRKLLGFARDLLRHMEEARLEDGHLGHTSFSPEVAACGFLLMLAHRTAMPHIRAEALELAQRFNQKEGVRDLCGVFIRWTRLPQPRPPFPFILGEPGH